MKEYIDTLTLEFEKSQNPEIALGQKAYMRDQFEYYGLKTTLRRVLQKPFLNKAYLPTKKELGTIVISLWSKPQRDYQYFGQELAYCYLKQTEPKDIELFEYMVQHKSWWDTVDFIATKLIGNYFKHYPDKRHAYVKRWLSSENIWLQRSALLFQLKYKEEIDTKLLRTTINSLLGTKEFFLNKAIGWVLREYSRTNPEWVEQFVQENTLSPLSKKEALRLLK
mgnify:CR=1 FL=1